MKKSRINKKSHVIYTDEPIRLGRRVVDFLPSPEMIAARSDTTKVTIALTKRSINFFKLQAKNYSIKYQKLIRLILDEYANNRQKAVDC